MVLQNSYSRAIPAATANKISFFIIYSTSELVVIKHSHPPNIGNSFSKEKRLVEKLCPFFIIFFKLLQCTDIFPTGFSVSTSKFTSSNLETSGCL